MQKQEWKKSTLHALQSSTTKHSQANKRSMKTNTLESCAVCFSPAILSFSGGSFTWQPLHFVSLLRCRWELLST
ncbi:hypothetical protein M5D96_001662 [Drosophila gunungcola]|uniref:Uncharacterized protein n=1 Tax=Drosophila gunungcola TaxID=103775 RepID=A0A9P9YYX4_9MUSC|nr:hypothetical protein M5D96_001662 [Drosophila gunungcola]